MKIMQRSILIIGLICFNIIFIMACKSKDVDYRDSSLPVEQRVSALMKQMTLEEKVGQMCQYVGLEHMRIA